MEGKPNDFIDCGNSESVSKLLSDNFESWSGNRSIFDFVEDKGYHFNMVYGLPRQGKSYFMRQLMQHYLEDVETGIIIIKDSVEEADIDMIRLSKDKYRAVVFSEPCQRVYDIIRAIADRKKDLIMKLAHTGKGAADMSRWIIFVDDVQAISKEEQSRLNHILALLAKQGRHSNFCTYLGIQNYKQVHKSIRAQASLFLSFFPLDSDYRDAVYREFFRVGTSSEFASIKLPRYTIMGSVKSEGRKFILWRDDKGESRRVVKKITPKTEKSYGFRMGKK